MHKSLYKFVKKRNKCDVTIKSTITKRIISGKKKKKEVETIKKIHQQRNKIGEREREFDLFEINNNKKNHQRKKKKEVESIKKIQQKRHKFGERKREREREFDLFAMKNLEGIRERCGNEVKRNS